MKHKIVLLAAACLFAVFVSTFIPTKSGRPVTVQSVAAAALGEESNPGDSTGVTSAPADEGIDVLQIINEMNGDNQPKPPSEFNPGHVSTTDITEYLTKTDNGFIIKLPGNTNVPTATVHDGRLYVSGGFGSKQYYAFHAQTGEKIWVIHLDDDGPSSGVIDDDIIVFNTESCTIFACERSTGNHLWSHWLGDPLMCMPAIANGIVFTAYPSYLNNTFTSSVKVKNGSHMFIATHVLAAFDLRTGKVIWQKWIDGDVMSAPVAKGEELFITTFPGTVYKFNQKDGEVLSARYMRATSAPVVHDDDIIVARRADNDTSGHVESITHINTTRTIVTKQYTQKGADYLDRDVQDKSVLKKESMNLDAGNGFAGGAPAASGAAAAAENIGQSNVSSLQSFQGSRTVIYNRLSYTTMGDEVICTDPTGGEVQWSSKLEGDLYRSGGFLGTPPLSAGGYIIVASFNGEVKLMNAETGALEKKYDTGKNIRYQPVVSDGWIYVTTTDGTLFAINTNDPKITGWPMWGADAAHSNAVQ